MPTLIYKLERYSNMKLVTMQGIAGVRGIVEDIEDVYSTVLNISKIASLVQLFWLKKTGINVFDSG